MNGMILFILKLLQTTNQAILLPVIYIYFLNKKAHSDYGCSYCVL